MEQLCDIPKMRRFSTVETNRRFSTVIEPNRRFSTVVEPNRRFSTVVEPKRRFSAVVEPQPQNLTVIYDEGFDHRRRIDSSSLQRRRHSTACRGFSFDNRRRFSACTDSRRRYSEVVEQDLILTLNSRPKRLREKKFIEIYFEESKIKDEAPKLSAKEAFRGFVFETLKNVFSLTSHEGEPSVTIDNVFPLMKALELDTKDEMVIDMVHEACIESFGNIEIDEFDQTIMGQRRRVTGEAFEDDIRSAFRLIDFDADGMITIQDLYQLMMGIGEMLTDEELMELLKTADNDGDGMVNYKDFKFFLTGELDEDKPEEIEEEEEKEEAKLEKEEGGNVAESVEKQEEIVTTEEPQEIKDISTTNESTENSSKSDQAPRRGLLWAFTTKTPEESTPKPEKSDMKLEMSESKDSPSEIEPTPSEIIPITPEDKSKSSEETSDTKHDDESQPVTDGPTPVTSVTVNYLDSVKEGEESVEPSPRQEGSALSRMDEKTRRELMNAATRRKPRKSMDSGFDTNDKNFSERSDSVTDDGFFSRTHSATSRKTNDKSRVSSAKSNFTSRPSTARSRFDEEGESLIDDEQDEQSVSSSKHSAKKTSKFTGEDIEEESDYEGSAIFEDDEFVSPLTKRQKDFLDHKDEQQTYCEAGVIRTPGDDISDDDTLDLESVIQDDPTAISPRVNLSRLKPKHSKAVPTLQRSRSATRLRTFKKIENVILFRQNTDPRLNIDHIKAINQRKIVRPEPPPKPNTNGIFCTHISIDLNIPEEQVKPKVNIRQTYSKKLLGRPQTAMTYREAQKLKIVDNRNDEFKSNECSNSGNVNIVNLSNSITIDTDRFERPGLINHHHGYKSVLPLGRVLSGYRNKINNGRGIVLNSISRKLERIAYTQQNSNESRNFTDLSLTRNQNVSSTTCRQAIINLEMPDFKSHQRKQFRSRARSWV